MKLGTGLGSPRSGSRESVFTPAMRCHSSVCSAANTCHCWEAQSSRRKSPAGHRPSRALLGLPCLRPRRAGRRGSVCHVEYVWRWLQQPLPALRTRICAALGHCTTGPLLHPGVTGLGLVHSCASGGPLGPRLPPVCCVTPTLAGWRQVSCLVRKTCPGQHSLMRLVELGALKKSGRYSHLMRAEFMGMARLQRHG